LDKSERLRIISKLEEMIKYVEELRDMLPEKEKYLGNLIIRRACEKTIEVAIKSLIDVAAMIVSAQKLGLPTSEENIFDKLIENNILTKGLSESLKDMKGFRNILIHRYINIDDEIVYFNLKNSINDFYKFKKEIFSYLKKQ